ncbi:hypothetical protein [Nonomuraea sp. NPDC023979]|uniref:hypothetical protein n=1 Tax=Nonomuraea sp. NPDC023979 TaxID=3154796 RepID=UPI00340DB4BB
MNTHDQDETVTTFLYNDTWYDIDHLGICSPNQAGTYALYCNDIQIAEFDHEPYPEDADLTFDTNLVAAAVRALNEA